MKASKFYTSKNYVEALDETFRLVDEAILSPQGAQQLKQYRSGTADGGYGNNADVSKGTGCTANVLLITPNKYIVANAGDSRSSLCRGGKAFDLSEDHKPES